MGNHPAVGKFEIMVPLANENVSNGADWGLCPEDKAVVPIVTKYRGKTIEKVHHHCYDQEKCRT